MIYYVMMILAIHGSAVVFDEKQKVEQIGSFLIFLPLYGRILGWW